MDGERECAYSTATRESRMRHWLVQTVILASTDYPDFAAVGRVHVIDKGRDWGSETAFDVVDTESGQC